MKYIMLIKLANLLLLVVIAFGIIRLGTRLHEIDQDVDNCSDFLQILSQSK